MEIFESLVILEHCWSSCVNVWVCGQSTVRAVRVVYALVIFVDRPRRYLHFTVALSENVTTWTINNLPAGRATVITVRFTQDSTDRTVVSTINSTAAKTQGGGPWTMSTGSGAIDLVTVLYDGTNYYLIPQQDWS